MANRKISNVEVKRLVHEWLEKRGISEAWPKVCSYTGCSESQQTNELGDDAITVALKDADRVVNTRLDVVIRSGQFQPGLPILDPVLLLNDKRGKHSNRPTILANVVGCLEWGNLEDQWFGVRTAGARAMIISRVARLREYLELIVEQREEEGLVPYPLT